MGFDILSLVQKKPEYNLTRLEFLVFLSLRRKPLHGYAIMKKLTSAMPGLWKVKSGSLYPLLKRMVKKGLIEKEKKRNVTKYALTPESRDAVDDYIAAWKELYFLFREICRGSKRPAKD